MKITESAQPRLTIGLRVAKMAKDRGFVIPTGPQRGRVNVSEVGRAADIAYTTADALIKNPEKVRAISLDVLAKLCATFHCTPGELFKLEEAVPTVRARLSDMYKADPEYDPHE
jgi:DNA-binding Xre family transcriptional regulator